MRTSVVDDEDAGAYEDGVDVLDGGSQQPDPGIDEVVGAEVAQNVAHEGEGIAAANLRQGLPNRIRVPCESGAGRGIRLAFEDPFSGRGHLRHQARFIVSFSSNGITYRN